MRNKFVSELNSTFVLEYALRV